MEITLKIKKVIIMRGSGTDKICFNLDGATPFPEMQAQDTKGDYSPYARVECRRGYAEEWLKQMGITEFNLIDYPS